MIQWIQIYRRRYSTGNETQQKKIQNLIQCWERDTAQENKEADTSVGNETQHRKIQTWIQAGNEIQQRKIKEADTVLGTGYNTGRYRRRYSAGYHR